jgi:type VI secretion system protein ImpC
LESAWRGLHYLVSSVESGLAMRVEVLDVSKRELSFMAGAGLYDQTPLFRKVHRERIDGVHSLLSVLIGDYAFDHTGDDVRLLSCISSIAASTHAPFIAAASPSLFGFGSWGQVHSYRDVSAIVSGEDYAAWRALRESEDARYVCLTAPRVLARAPYALGPGAAIPSGLGFHEDAPADDHARHVWMNSAYVLAASIARSVALSGEPCHIDGLINCVPATGPGTMDDPRPFDVVFEDRIEDALGRCGLSSLVRLDAGAAFVGTKALQRPPVYDNAEATAQARLGLRLPLILQTCRFVHGLMDLLSSERREDVAIEKAMNDWLAHYVRPVGAVASGVDVPYPLEDAVAKLVEASDGAGGHEVVAWLRLEGFAEARERRCKFRVPQPF